MVKIRKILIANRGEIAVRIIRAAESAGIRTVAIYADQDRNAKFVRLADEAYALRGQTADETYLDVDKILEIARKTGANAVHPGYGFLSENAEFAEEVIGSNLVWVGAPPPAIRSLGDKVSARKIAKEVGAPLTPGTSEPVESPDEVLRFAEEYGLPLAIKAAHGGGGRGLRVVRTVEEIPEKFSAAVREALNSFGNGSCFIEKYLESPRHVETQCLADSGGNVVVISTRDCSLQRRHQKVVEEAPAPFISPKQQELIYETSKKILRAVGYEGAGTCEFLLARDGTVAFLEVNTRLQVEHPVSEEVTGIDLVREQFRIAEGELIGYEDPSIRGHSIEFRINGEDPGNAFIPAPGLLGEISFPEGPGIRIDSGITRGDRVSGAFDSLLAKIIITGSDRPDAIHKARDALARTEVAGIPTTLPFHRLLLEEADFVAATEEDFKVHTRWMEEDFSQELLPWEKTVEVGLEEREDYRDIVVEIEGRRSVVSFPLYQLSACSENSLSPAPQRQKRDQFRGSAGSSGQVNSPMQASVIKVLAAVGQFVSAGDVLFVLEAMKMEQLITAPINGIVHSVEVAAGGSVGNGERLCELKLLE